MSSPAGSPCPISLPSEAQLLICVSTPPAGNHPYSTIVSGRPHYPLDGFTLSKGEEVFDAVTECTARGLWECRQGHAWPRGIHSRPLRLRGEEPSSVSVTPGGRYVVQQTRYGPQSSSVNYIHRYVGPSAPMARTAGSRAAPRDDGPRYEGSR